MPVSDAADKEQALVALRDRLASVIDEADPARVALGPLVKQYRDVVDELERLHPEVTRADDLAQRRAARRGTKAKGPSPAKRGVIGGK